MISSVVNITFDAHVLQSFPEISHITKEFYEKGVSFIVSVIYTFTLFNKIFADFSSHDFSFFLDVGNIKVFDNFISVYVFSVNLFDYFFAEVFI